MTHEEKKNFQEVEKAFSQLQDAFSGIKCGQYGNKLYKLNIQEEKEHRRGSPDSVTPGLTTAQGAKYFYVRFLVDYIEGKQKRPTIKDVLTMRPSAIMSATLCENYPNEIKKALEGVNIDVIDTLDYAELMKDDVEKVII
jgi:hypothetical protein